MKTTSLTESHPTIRHTCGIVISPLRLEDEGEWECVLKTHRLGDTDKRDEKVSEIIPVRISSNKSPDDDNDFSNSIKEYQFDDEAEGGG